MPIKRTYSDILQNGRTRLEQNSPVNNFNSQSISKAFLDIQAVELEKIYDSYHVGQTYIDILGNNYYITKKLPSAIYFIRNRQLGKLNNDPICMGSLVFIEKMDYEFGFETHESIVNEYKTTMCCD